MAAAAQGATPGEGAPQEEVVLKLLTLGDTATGKTSFIKQYVAGKFPQQHKPTLGVDFHFKHIDRKNKRVNIQLWDIAGQDRFGVIYRVYYKDAYGALLLFDLTNRESFTNTLRWKREIDSKVKLPSGDDLPVMLVANKCDLPEDSWAVRPSELGAFCEEHGFTNWIQTSARERTNVEECVEQLVDTILEDDKVFEVQREAAKAREEVHVQLEQSAEVERNVCC